MNAKLYGLMGGIISGIGFLTAPVAAQGIGATGPDQELVTRLHQLGQDKIAMAQLGETRAVSDDVRTLAQTVERDQRAADNGLIAYAQRKNMDRIQVAEPGGALEHGVLARAPLVNCARDVFDYYFAEKMVADHQAAIDAAAAAERLARDPELKAVINDNLKVLTENLIAAQELQARIPTPAPRTLQLPAYPVSPSRTQTGADLPPPGTLR
jgi:predicted outer membrane protein